jgi:hypothetical protein
MVRSLLVVIGLVAVVYLLFAHPQAQVKAPAVDVAAPTQDAVDAGLPVAVPAVPAGWRATSARYSPDTTEGLPTWHVGYLTRAKTYAGVDVAQGATPAWVEGIVGEDADRHGSRTVGGATWQLWRGQDDAGTRTSLVRTDDQVTRVVSTTGSRADLDALAGAVRG